MRMARDDNWTVWFGKAISTMVLAPLAMFFTYKANNDSTVFNMDAYRLFFMRVLGLRQKRNVAMKEVVIDEPDYRADAEQLAAINVSIEDYSREHRLLRWPNPFKVFFRPGDDRQIMELNERLEATIDDLQNSRDKQVIHLLNQYPVVATHAHTRPFRQRWLNAIVGLILPLGIFFYFRMLRFRFRLYKDLKAVTKTSQSIVTQIDHITDNTQ